YLRFAHVYIIGIWQVGFRFAGIKVSFLPESRFPFRRIHGFPAPEYSALRLFCRLDFVVFKDFGLFLMWEV
ncbi:MAG: hypothetical protein IJ741_08505, partial [Schwartzia sp.]|nr:hypothetical protein [Schwartzia sp. (in: firmicutes)]